MTAGDILHKLWVGACLRCPHCERGRTFSGLLKVNQTCSVCGLRFEQEDGESVGGMYINLALAELTTMGGFFLIHSLYQPPVLPHLTFWVAYNIIFVVLFYRHSRSMWMSVSYLTGGARHNTPPS
ncbi:MAG: DUF983 domain-containing protein [Anaerolineae bacterium]|nr:DUF983 domain-containing protein [Anaerolineae bacterium]